MVYQHFYQRDWGRTAISAVTTVSVFQLKSRLNRPLLLIATLCSVIMRWWWTWGASSSAGLDHPVWRKPLHSTWSPIIMRHFCVAGPGWQQWKDTAPLRSHWELRPDSNLPACHFNTNLTDKTLGTKAFDLLMGQTAHQKNHFKSGC